MKTKTTLLTVILVFVIVFLSHAQKQTNNEGILHLPSNVKASLLMSSEDLSFFNDKIYPDIFGQFWMIKDSLMLCADFENDASNMEILRLPKEIKQCRELLWLAPNKIIILDGDNLKILEQEQIRSLSELPYKNMNIVAASDSSIYVFGKTTKETNSYELFLYNTNGKWMKICELDKKINAVLGDGIMTFVAAGEKIYALDFITESSILYSGDDEILSLAATEDGNLFFSTTKTINYTDDLETTYSFANIGASKLWCFNDNLYILHVDNSLIKIAPTSNFKEFNISYIQDCNLNSTAEYHWNKAERLFNASQNATEFLLAANEYDNVLKHSPNCAGAYYNKAVCYELMGKLNSENYDIATKCYQKYIELAPNAEDKIDVQRKIRELENKKDVTANTYIQKGIDVYKEKNYDKAIEYFKKAIEIDPNCALAYSHLGNMYSWKNEYEQAIAYNYKALEIDNDFARAYRSLGNSYLSLGNADYALYFLKVFVKLDAYENSYDAYDCYNLGIDNYNSMNKYLAIAYFYNVVNLFPQILYTDPNLASRTYYLLAKSYSSGYYIQMPVTNSSVCIYYHLNEVLTNYELSAYYAYERDGVDKKNKQNKRNAIEAYHRLAFLYLNDLRDKSMAKWYWSKAAKLGDRAARQNKRGL